jgi:hypothetical protein
MIRSFLEYSALRASNALLARWFSQPYTPRVFGPSAVSDPRDALQYLLGESGAKANDRVQALYAHIQTDRNSDDFLLTFYLLMTVVTTPPAMTIGT